MQHLTTPGHFIDDYSTFYTHIYAYLIALDLDYFLLSFSMIYLKT